MSGPLPNVRVMSQCRFRRTPGGVSSLGLHLVWCPKHRCRILGGHLAARCGELLEQIADERGWPIVAKEVVPDHVHLFVPVEPARCANSGGASVQGPRRAGAAPRISLPAQQCEGLWSPSDFTASMGYVSESKVRRYIEHEWYAELAS